MQLADWRRLRNSSWLGIINVNEIVFVAVCVLSPVATCPFVNMRAGPLNEIEIASQLNTALSCDAFQAHLSTWQRGRNPPAKIPSATCRCPVDARSTDGELCVARRVLEAGHTFRLWLCNAP